MDTSNDKKVFRNSLTTRLYAAILLIPTCICGGYVFAARALPAKVLLGVGATFGLGLVFRMLISGIVLDSGGVFVRGLLRNRRFSWTEVAGFSFRSGSALNSTVYIAVDISGGRNVHTTGLTAASKTSRYGAKVIAAMEAVRDRSA